MTGHVRQGRRYLSPLAATGVFDMIDWVRDDLPDLLWPVLVLTVLGTPGARQLVRWQNAVQQRLAQLANPAALANGLDGRLTSLDMLVDALPQAQDIVISEAESHGILPETVQRVLSLYLERPAAWLVRLSRPVQVEQADLNLLARSIIEITTNGHRESLIKCLPIWSAVKARTFRTSQATIDLLSPYPNDPATREQADSVVRATWGAMKKAALIGDPHRFDKSTDWASVFWRINSAITPCVRTLEADSQSPEKNQSGEESLVETGLLTAAPAGSTHFRRTAMDLVASYIEALESSPSDLRTPEKHEVHSGLIMRAGREVITVLGIPNLWCLEHGAHIGRMLTETRIHLQWMGMQDASIYRRYQDYGAGKAKLYARIMSEIPIEEGDAAVEGIKEFERLSHNHNVLDTRIVDTSDSFAGVSLRSMANECGLLDLYRHTYSVSSGVTHSEWWAIETNCMQRCFNILHGGHLIPSLELSLGENVALAKSWLDTLYTLIKVSLQILGTDIQAVNNAFSWMAANE